MSSQNYIRNIAIVGAGGQVGAHIARAIIAQGKHNLTAITRPESTNTLPAGLHATKHVTYDDHSGLVSALQGQDALIITMNVLAPPDSQKKLIDAAVEAGVRYVMPNEFGTDVSDEQFAKDCRIGAIARKNREYIESVTKGTETKWVSLSCGFWYEYSLSGSEARYGFDFTKKTLTLIGEGEGRTCTTTFPQCGLAVAKLFALPIHPTTSSPSKALTLSSFNNSPCFINSFVLSQKDMFASVLRVLGDKESDWTVTKEDHVARYNRGVKMMESGDMTGFGILLYSRVLYPDSKGDFSTLIVNKELGLPEEDLDAWTKKASETGMHGIGERIEK